MCLHAPSAGNRQSYNNDELPPRRARGFSDTYGAPTYIRHLPSSSSSSMMHARKNPSPTVQWTAEPPPPKQDQCKKACKALSLGGDAEWERHLTPLSQVRVGGLPLLITTDGTALNSDPPPHGIGTASALRGVCIMLPIRRVLGLGSLFENRKRRAKEVGRCRFQQLLLRDMAIRGWV